MHHVFSMLVATSAILENTSRSDCLEVKGLYAAQTAFYFRGPVHFAQGSSCEIASYLTPVR